jgi:hypothetical protein
VAGISLLVGGNPPGVAVPVNGFAGPEKPTRALLVLYFEDNPAPHAAAYELAEPDTHFETERFTDQTGAVVAMRARELTVTAKITERNPEPPFIRALAALYAMLPVRE